jgi:hypothetical protein
MVKFVSTQQARPYNIYKKTKLKLLEANAAIWFNKICRENQLQPKYISFKSNGNKQQDRKTVTNAIRLHINQEIKFLYKKKQYLNQQLYQSQLECAHHHNGIWQHIQTIIDQNLHQIMEDQYQKLNKKLDRKRSDFKRF